MGIWYLVGILCMVVGACFYFRPKTTREWIGLILMGIGYIVMKVIEIRHIQNGGLSTKQLRIKNTHEWAANRDNVIDNAFRKMNSNNN